MYIYLPTKKGLLMTNDQVLQTLDVIQRRADELFDELRAQFTTEAALARTLRHRRVGMCTHGRLPRRH